MHDARTIKYGAADVGCPTHCHMMFFSCFGAVSLECMLLQGRSIERYPITRACLQILSIS